MATPNRFFARLLLIVATTCIASVAIASSHRYIVVLEPRGNLSEKDVVAAGGTIEERFIDHIVVTLPTPDALRGVAGVKYVQSIGGSRDLTPRPDDVRTASPSRTHIEASPPTWGPMSYSYDATGNIYAIGGDAFAYDLDSRLKQWTKSGDTSATETYAYDAYGNMIAYKRFDQSSATSISVDANTNHLNSDTYDHGNDTSFGTTTPQTTVVYDSLNMPVQTGGAGGTAYYLYTADDERIGVLTGDTWNWSLRGFDHEVLRQFRSSNSVPTSPWIWVEDYVYRGSQLLAAERVAEEGGRRHFHLDTPRLITGNDGVVVSEHDYTPFGLEYTIQNQEIQAGFDREEPKRFTGHERDYLGYSDYLAAPDYMHARGYSPSRSRFLSVDSHTGSVSAPQSWNRYSYAKANPAIYIDQDGRDVTLFIRDSSGGGGLTNFGHTAIRVFGKGYDFTFDFGRYRQTHLLIYGEGILRRWTNWEAFLKKQSTHGASRTVTWQTPRAYDSAVIAFFEHLVKQGEQTNQTADYAEYKLSRDYSVFGTNCTTLTCESMSAGEAQTGYILEGFDQFFSRVASPSEAWSVATEYDLAYGPDAVKRILSMDLLFDEMYSALYGPHK